MMIELKHSMKTICAFITLLSMLVISAPAAAVDKLADQAKQAIEAFQKADSGMAKLFTNSIGYVVFPSVGKGGLVFGGAHGKGLVYQRGRLIGRSALTQITFGAQVGGQSFSEVIFFENDAVLEHFKESNVEMSAQVSAVAVAEGAAQNARYVQGVAVFARPLRGLMAEASIGGQKLRFVPLDKKSGNQ